MGGRPGPSVRGDHGTSPRGQGGLSRDRGRVCRGGGGGGGVVRVAYKVGIAASSNHDSSLKLLCAFKHHGAFDPPRRTGTIFAYCLFVNTHLLEKGTLLQTSGKRLPPIKSNNCYNVRYLCFKHCVFIVFWLARRHTCRHGCPYWNHRLCLSTP